MRVTILERFCSVGDREEKRCVPSGRGGMLLRARGGEREQSSMRQGKKTTVGKEEGEEGVKS
jgi:hypothetical protein